LKFGVSTFVWVSPFTTRDISILYKVKELGFDGIEIAIENLSAINLREVKKALKVTGLGCVLCGIFDHRRNIISNNPSVRKNAKSYIVDCINACTELGSDILCGSVHAAPGKTQLISAEEKKRRWVLCVSNLREMADFAYRKGVTIAIEPLNRFRSDFINTAEEAIRLIEDVNSPGLKVHLDSFHMNIEEKKLGKAIKRTGKYLYHFHACENDWGTPGTGHIDWEELASALKNLNYNRYIVIESFNPRIKKIAEATSTWRKLEVDQDTLARNGLKFLKELSEDR